MSLHTTTRRAPVATTANSRHSALSIAREFFKHPAQTGALAPATPSLAEAMCRAANIPSRQSVVEFGPGTGVITEGIINHLANDADFFALELNAHFAELSRERCPGATIFEADATQLPHYLEQQGWADCDAIVSSLPWTLIKSDRQDALLDVIEDSLNSGGVFVTYLYTFSQLSSNSRTFVDKLKSRFTGNYERKSLFPHLPPTNIYICKK